MGPVFYHRQVHSRSDPIPRQSHVRLRISIRKPKPIAEKSSNVLVSFSSTHRIQACSQHNRRGHPLSMESVWVLAVFLRGTGLATSSECQRSSCASEPAQSRWISVKAYWRWLLYRSVWSNRRTLRIRPLRRLQAQWYQARYRQIHVGRWSRHCRRMGKRTMLDIRRRVAKANH